MLYLNVGDAPAQMTDSPEAAALIVTHHAARMALELNNIVMHQTPRDAAQDRADIDRSEAINAAYRRIMYA